MLIAVDLARPTMLQLLRELPTIRVADRIERRNLSRFRHPRQQRAPSVLSRAVRSGNLFTTGRVNCKHTAMDTDLDQRYVALQRHRSLEPQAPAQEPTASWMGCT